ncbi:MAG: hypothetical protein RBS40_09140 [Rhodocyclaceae bacterium]|jgi:type IV pilus assembly protein PilW|nr:hypothetical protein [Rhodocyclaceae bacterium]
MLTNHRKSQRGINLVELMIGLVVGLIVLAAMSAVYLNTSRGSRDTLNANRLNQDLRAIMDIMVADIRRAGYWGTADTGNNPFTGGTTNLAVTSSCILYSYDATYNGGTAGAQDPGVDFFGFHYGSNAVQMIKPSVNLSSTNTSACNTTSNWENVSDPNVITVTALSFETGGSQCMNTTASPSVTWTTAAGSTSAACADTTASGYVAPTSGDVLVETRQVTITLTAQHAQDTTLTRSLTETVLVRNNRILTAH